MTLRGHDRPRCRVARERYLEAIRRAGGEPVPVDPGEDAPETFDAVRTAQVSPAATRIFGAFVRAAERVAAR